MREIKMKKFFAIAVCFAFVANAFADDWRMRKFDLDKDQLITKSELLTAGCSVRATKSLFNHADKNSDGALNKREARNASAYIFKRRCPRNPLVVPEAIGVRG